MCVIPATFGNGGASKLDMNHYPFTFGILFTLILACIVPNPLWFLILGVGMAANGLVIALNGWKMPVRGRIEETEIHKSMDATTRQKWMADIIPTGVGKASIGDIFIVSGLLGVIATRSYLAYANLIALICIVLWSAGWAKGFRLLEKWPKPAIRHFVKGIPLTIALLLVGNLLRIRGCSVNELRASTETLKSIAASSQPKKTESKPTSKWRNLGTVASPPIDILHRLKADTEKQEKQRILTAAISATQDVTRSLIPTLKNKRSGPFCRVTCNAHHGGQYDVETVPELCRANWMPPTAEYVPGWYAVSDKEEVTNPWPGPAQAGFENYKLYWSELQSGAKVISHATMPVSDH